MIDLGKEQANMTLKQFLCELADTAYNTDGNFDSNTLDQYTLLGSRSTRRVYQIEHDGKEYAVKFAFWEGAREYNRRELRYWNTFRDTTRKMMAQVHGVSTCGRVLAMEKVETTLYDAHRGDECEPWNRELRAQLETHEALTETEAYRMVSDNASFNVGVRANGDIVWIDYAQPGR